CALALRRALSGAAARRPELPPRACHRRPPRDVGRGARRAARGHGAKGASSSSGPGPAGAGVDAERLGSPGPRMQTSVPERPGADLWIAAGLGALAVLYLMQLPPILGPADDAYYLYHAKRTLHGEVAYRDFFDFLAPLFVDLYTLLFAVF